MHYASKDTTLRIFDEPVKTLFLLLTFCLRKSQLEEQCGSTPMWSDRMDRNIAGNGGREREMLNS